MLCNTGNLTEIPHDFPRETQEIVITNQNISVIPPKSRCQKMDQSHVQTKVHSRHPRIVSAFSHLKQLRRLILDSNNISEVRPFAFKVSLAYSSSSRIRVSSKRCFVGSARHGGNLRSRQSNLASTWFCFRWNPKRYQSILGLQPPDPNWWVSWTRFWRARHKKVNEQNWGCSCAISSLPFPHGIL